MPTRKTFLVFSASLLFLFLASSLASAQSEERKPATVQPDKPKFDPTALNELKFEVGGQFTAFIPGGIGVGGRLTYNLNRYLALEGEMNYLPSSGYADTRVLQGQFGIKSGRRFDKFGFFGKIRPGFANTKFDYYYFSDPIISTVSRVTISQTNFSMDLGGVVEFYPAKRWIVRVDIGDTMVRTGGTIFPFSGSGTFLAVPGGVSHNLQISTGIGFRF
ncbi:MAG TPA: outer membrane beta-barrel protein [Blastocatellia bacterium]|nr:outer membrane beta-barrel protein [Blastocatellia bacterium]